MFVERNPAERRIECFRLRQREAVHRDPVTGTEDHDAFDDAARGAQPVVCARGDGSGIGERTWREARSPP
jgi:hypothetical protein